MTKISKIDSVKLVIDRLYIDVSKQTPDLALNLLTDRKLLENVSFLRLNCEAEVVNFSLTDWQGKTLELKAAHFSSISLR